VKLCCNKKITNSYNLNVLIQKYLSTLFCIFAKKNENIFKKNFFEKNIFDFSGIFFLD